MSSSLKLRSVFFFFLMGFSQVALCDSKVKLVLNWKPEPQFGGFYEAARLGAYKKLGLDVEILPGGSGTPTIQMVAAGSADYGIVSADELIISRSKGSDIVALFAVYQTNPQGIMTHAERHFSDLGDVYNQEGTLAIQSGLPYSLFLAKKYSKPKVQVVPYLGGITNFIADPKMSQQCFITSEPIAAEKLGKKVKTFLISEAGFNPYTTVLVTRKEHYQKATAEVKNMVRAVREGCHN